MEGQLMKSPAALGGAFSSAITRGKRGHSLSSVRYINSVCGGQPPSLLLFNRRRHAGYRKKWPRELIEQLSDALFLSEGGGQ